MRESRPTAFALPQFSGAYAFLGKIDELEPHAALVKEALGLACVGALLRAEYLKSHGTRYNRACFP